MAAEKQFSRVNYPSVIALRQFARQKFGSLAQIEWQNNYIVGKWKLTVRVYALASCCDGRIGCSGRCGKPAKRGNLEKSTNQRLDATWNRYFCARNRSSLEVVGYDSRRRFLPSLAWRTLGCTRGMHVLASTLWPHGTLIPRFHVQLACIRCLELHLRCWWNNY